MARRSPELKRPIFYFELCRKLADMSGKFGVTINGCVVALPDLGTPVCAGSTGFTGVNISVNRRRCGPKEVVAVFFQASHTPVGGRHLTRSFSISAHGYAQAYMRAVIARAEMIGYSAPIPPLDPPPVKEVIENLVGKYGEQWVEENRYSLKQIIIDTQKAAA